MKPLAAVLGLLVAAAAPSLAFVVRTPDVKINTAGATLPANRSSTAAAITVLASTQNAEDSASAAPAPAAAVGAPKGVAGLNAWDPSSQQASAKWMDPALHNSNPFRVAALIVAVGLAARGSLASTTAVLPAFVHVLSFGMLIGSTFYTTFVAGIIMFQNLPRQTFGKLQSKLFPVYFCLNSMCAVAMLVTLHGLTSGGLPKDAAIPLVGALVCNLGNLFVLEPRSTSVMLARYELENKGEAKGAEYDSLARTFGKLHGISSLLNLGALVGAFAYAWRLARFVVL